MLSRLPANLRTPKSNQEEQRKSGIKAPTSRIAYVTPPQTFSANQPSSIPSHQHKSTISPPKTSSVRTNNSINSAASSLTKTQEGKSVSMLEKFKFFNKEKTKCSPQRNAGKDTKENCSSSQIPHNPRLSTGMKTPMALRKSSANKVGINKQDAEPRKAPMTGPLQRRTTHTSSTRSHDALSHSRIVAPSSTSATSAHKTSSIVAPASSVSGAASKSKIASLSSMTSSPASAPQGKTSKSSSAKSVKESPAPKESRISRMAKTSKISSPSTTNSKRPTTPEPKSHHAVNQSNAAPPSYQSVCAPQYSSLRDPKKVIGFVAPRTPARVSNANNEEKPSLPPPKATGTKSSRISTINSQNDQRSSKSFRVFSKQPPPAPTSNGACIASSNSTAVTRPPGDACSSALATPIPSIVKPGSLTPTTPLKAHVSDHISSLRRARQRSLGGNIDSPGHQATPLIIPPAPPKRKDSVPIKTKEPACSLQPMAPITTITSMKGCTKRYNLVSKQIPSLDNSPAKLSEKISEGYVSDGDVLSRERYLSAFSASTNQNGGTTTSTAAPTTPATAPTPGVPIGASASANTDITTSHVAAFKSSNGTATPNGHTPNGHAPNGHASHINGYASEGCYESFMNKRYQSLNHPPSLRVNHANEMAEDSFDDASSIGSAAEAISDTINEVSTDDNITSSTTHAKSARPTMFTPKRMVTTSSFRDNVDNLLNKPLIDDCTTYDGSRFLKTLDQSKRADLQNGGGESIVDFTLMTSASAVTSPVSANENPIGSGTQTLPSRRGHMITPMSTPLSAANQNTSTNQNPQMFQRSDIMRHSFNHTIGAGGIHGYKYDTNKRPISSNNNGSSAHILNLSCAGSMESLSSQQNMSLSIQSQIQQAKALAKASRNILNRDRQTSQGNALDCTVVNRSPMKECGLSAARPACEQVSRPTSLQRTDSYSQVLIYPEQCSPEEDIRGSSLSLVSSSSSMQSTNEEKQFLEIKKLKKELESAKLKVHNLTSQLSTNVQVVSAFEQSLMNMSKRLQSLSSSSEQKDSELSDLRKTLEAVQRQHRHYTNGGSGVSTNGLTPVAMSTPNGHHHNNHNNNHHYHHHDLSLPSTPCRPKSHSISQSSRKLSSADSVVSLNSLSSVCSATSQHSSNVDFNDLSLKKKKKNWLRSSFTKAFSNTKKPIKPLDYDDDCDANKSNNVICASLPPRVPQSHIGSCNDLNDQQDTISQTASYATSAADVDNLMRANEMALTDVRLEALASAHQLDQMKELVCKMKTEMVTLKCDNVRLNEIVSSKGLDDSSNSKSISFGSSKQLEMILSTPSPRENRLTQVCVSCTDHTSETDVNGQYPSAASSSSFGSSLASDAICLSESSSRPPHDSSDKSNLDAHPVTAIGRIPVTSTMSWPLLDSYVGKVFLDYIKLIHGSQSLGLSEDSILCYKVGEIVRDNESDIPELLPCGYLIGDVEIVIQLKSTKQSSVDELCFHTLIPKPILLRYVSLLVEHRRVILSGPSGTGKSFLAQKLANHVVQRCNLRNKSHNIECNPVVQTFNIAGQSTKDLKQYLCSIADKCRGEQEDIPGIIILESLHNVSSTLSEVFNVLLMVKPQTCPYIIGTMQHPSNSSTNLQLHHNFRWILCANHCEPVRTFLQRYLQKQLAELRLSNEKTKTLDLLLESDELETIIKWLPTVWKHINSFLENHSSTDITIGPRMFLNCPMDIDKSRIWFTELWNFSIIPYLIDAVREGIQLYGRRDVQWDDPTRWVVESYPWSNHKQGTEALLRLRANDVGYDLAIGCTSSTTSTGPGAPTASLVPTSALSAPTPPVPTPAPQVPATPNVGDVTSTAVNGISTNNEDLNEDSSDALYSMLLKLKEATCPQSVQEDNMIKT